MAFLATAVANEFLKHAKDSGEPLTPMHVQKLIFFAYGWYIAFKDEPLIGERVEAWEYGPLVPTLYHEFKRYGSGPITDFAKEPNWEKLDFTSYIPWIDEASCPEDQKAYAKALIARIWQVYGSFTALQLSRMTHEPGTPWSQAKEQGKRTIPDDLIREYFTQLATQNEQPAQAAQ